MAQNKFPEILTNLRKKRGLSQKEAAAELGISPALLSHYEKGIRECSLDFLIKVSDYFSVSCDYLLGHSAKKNVRSKESQRARLFNRSIEALMLIFDQTDDENFTKWATEFLKLSMYRIFMLFDGIVDGLKFDGRHFATDYSGACADIAYTRAKEYSENLKDSNISVSPSTLNQPENIISDIEAKLKTYDLL